MVLFSAVLLLLVAYQAGAIPTDLVGGYAAYQTKLNEYLATKPKVVAQEANMSVPELIKHKGYPVETHTVVTSDGYIIELHRIPFGRDGPSVGRPVAFLQHGLLSSSADWIVSGPEKAFGYYLADEGYDVWLSNCRGNKYGRKNIYLDPDLDKNQFWDFSWHEIGTIDLPEQIDYVLAKTGAKNLFHVGYSQGATAFYVMLSEKPEYNRKIRAHFSLAPLTYMKDAFSPLLQLIAKMGGSIEWISQLIGMHEFLPNTKFLAEVGEILCGDDSYLQLLCTNSLFAICGFSHKQMNATMLPVLMGHTPAGSSTKQLMHYGQSMRSSPFVSQFSQYDYGLIGNWIKYGQTSPPDYKLENVKVPVYVFYSENDWLASMSDVDKLIKKILKQVKGKILVADKKFNHLDYMYGIEARDLVYDFIVPIMNRLK